MLAALVLLSGCAVQTGPGGKVNIGLDDAEIFGQAVDSFRLGDGSEGKVRVLGGRYSVKLQKQLKVVPITNATMVRVASVQQVGGRTLLVLDKAERNCGHKTQILSILGSEVLTWDFGDCQTQPQASADADQAVFDFVQPRRTVRYIYREGRLVRGEFATPAGGLPSAATPLGATPVDSSAPRYRPGPPVSAVGPVAKPVQVTPMVAATPAPQRTPVAAAAPRPPAPARLEFPTQEQKPVRIVLDN